MKLPCIPHTSLTTRLYILVILVVILTCSLIASCGTLKGHYNGERNEWELEYYGSNGTNEFGH